MKCERYNEVMNRSHLRAPKMDFVGILWDFGCVSQLKEV